MNGAENPPWQSRVLRGCSGTREIPVSDILTLKRKIKPLRLVRKIDMRPKTGEDSFFRHPRMPSAGVQHSENTWIPANYMRE